MSGVASNMSMDAKADVEIKRLANPGRASVKAAAPAGRFHVEHWRDGKLIGDYDVPNAITNEGKNFALNSLFDGGTQITQWYVGLIDDTGATLAATDNYDNINQPGNGWDEFSTYTDAANTDSAVTRPAWPNDAAASQSMSNSTAMIFDITSSGTVHGMFLCGGTNAQTKGNHAPSVNFLYATAPFTGSAVPVLNLDQLKAVYTVNG